MEKVLTKRKPAGFTILSGKNFSDLFIGILGFFLGRVVVFEFVSVFAIAYLAAFFCMDYRFYFVTFFVILGLFTKLKGLFLVKYLICIGGIVLANVIITRKVLRPRTMFQCFTGAFFVLLSGIIISILDDVSLFFMMVAFLEGALTFALTFVLKKGLTVVDSKRRRKVLNNEEIISVSILFGGIIAGAADIYVGSVSLKFFFLILVVLIFAFKGGSALSAMAAVLLGLMLYLTKLGDINMILVLSIAGMAGGALNKYGKPAAILGFLAGGVVTIFCLDKSIITNELIFSFVTAGIGFLIIPDNFYFNISNAFNPVMDNTDEYIARIKELTNTRLLVFADSFKKLSRTFSSISEKKSSLDQNDISSLIDELAAKVCNNCVRKDVCWGEKFYNTYQTVFGILDICENKGKISLDDIPAEFKESCNNVSAFGSMTNRLFELYKTNISWHNKIVESRDLVSQQLKGVSGIIRNLADELELSAVFKEELEENIKLELSKNKIEVEKVIVLENKLGKYEVTTKQKSCFGKKNCTKEILPVLNRMLGRKMKVEDNNCNYSSNSCQKRFVEEQKYRISSAVAKLTKTDSKESGDCYSFMELKNGQCMLVLSDGMGSGKKASSESRAAIELLEDFMESGFEKELAIRMINSVLVLKGNEDTFSTMDICSVDLYSGVTEFVKIGASATFLIRDGDVRVIKSSSLPMGILNTVDLEVCSKKLKKNDIVLMVTDGILDNLDTYEEKENWIVDILNGFNSSNPQDIADYILEEAKKISGKVIKDDMTVLAAKIWEKAG